MKKLSLCLLVLFFTFAANAQQNENPYDDPSYVDVSWLFPYALRTEQQIIEDGMRLVTEVSKGIWPTDQLSFLKAEFIFENKTYVFKDRLPTLLGTVEHGYAQEIAQVVTNEINANNCFAHVTINWQQSGGCRTPFYKEIDGIYEPVTCEDQGITASYATEPRAYYIVSFEYCQEAPNSEKLQSQNLKDNQDSSFNSLNK